MQDIDKIPSIALINLLIEANNHNNQQLVNVIAYELAKRIYNPESEWSFNKVASDFGYKEGEDTECIRGR